MSIGFSCGGAPSNLVVPVTLPSPAALTLRVAFVATRATATNANIISKNLKRQVMQNLLGNLLVLRPSHGGRSVRVDRLQAKLLSDGFFLFVVGTVRLQAAQVKDQVPCFVRLHVVRERGHRRAVQTGHENLVEILVSGAAFETSAIVEVERLDRTILVVGESVSRGAVRTAFRAMALPAFQLLEKSLARLDAISGNFRFGQNFNRRSGFFGDPSRREVLD